MPRNNAVACLMVGLALLGLLGGCVGRYPLDPKEQALWHVNNADKHAQGGDYKTAAFMLAKAACKPGGAEAAKAMLSKSPVIKENLYSYLQQTSANTTDKEELIRLASYISIFEKNNIILGIEKIAKELDVRAAQENISGKINWLLSDDISNFASLQNNDAKNIIFKRTVSTLTDKDRPKELAKALVEYLSDTDPNSTDMQFVKEQLGKVILSRSELQQFENIFPDLVKEKLANLTVNIQVIVSPADRLFEEDVKEKLRQMSANYNMMKSGETGDKNTINITIEKARLEERQLPNTKQTITYAQHEVNLVSAVMLMPRNASYVFDYEKGGLELEYGYVLKIIQGCKILLDELIRGTLTKNFVSCSNQKVVNVFGGTTRADFTANSEMASMCSGATNSPPSIQQLRKQVLKLVVDKIVSVDILASRVE